MSNIKDVKEMYEMYPYPTTVVGDSLIKDTANLLEFMIPEEDMVNKKVLDAGCGTGHRLIEIAKRYPDTQFLGVDISSSSLEIARKLAKRHGVNNVTFLEMDLLEGSLDEKFDIIITTGVLHHLPEPTKGLHNLCKLLTDEGVIIIWLYHALGEHNRLLEREMLMTLWSDTHKEMAEGLKIMQELNLKIKTNQYGSTASQKEEEVSQLSIDVDAYMHPIVHAFRFQEALELFLDSEVDWVAVNGINMEGMSKLLNLAEVDDIYDYFCVKIYELLKSPELVKRYRKLDNLHKLKIIELLIKPTGFTLIAGKQDCYKNYGPRIEGNIISVK